MLMKLRSDAANIIDQDKYGQVRMEATTGSDCDRGWLSILTCWSLNLRAWPHHDPRCAWSYSTHVRLLELWHLKQESRFKNQKATLNSTMGKDTCACLLYFKRVGGIDLVKGREYESVGRLWLVGDGCYGGETINKYHDFKHYLWIFPRWPVSFIIMIFYDTFYPMSSVTFNFIHKYMYTCIQLYFITQVQLFCK